ncbi:di-heme oxidoredictase family protein [Cerasicoccus maritimus]|uniref:di-heme oxidoreductase family protein n=1 Tax=Cerasicoccus maritimus TaxID=490089 RepID=UPI002852C650|nr:di-heme oxidoredictase family protein [Cerasicoccus maritimus]
MRVVLYLGMIVSLGVFAVTVYSSYWKAKTGYGDDWESLAILDGKHPDSLTGGDLTHFKFGNISFEQEPYNLHWKLSALFDGGDGVFERPFSEAQSFNDGHYADGLGPLYNAKSCEACHVADGRSAAPSNERGFEGFLLRVSIPGKGANGGPKHHPVYGGQLADNANQGHQPEVKIAMRYEEIPGMYPDGTGYTLRKPIYDLTETNYGPLGDDAMISPRIAPSMIGMGLLDAITPAEIIAYADPDDADNDGISGKVNWVWDIEAKEMAVGKYGWKAETPNLRQQAADAAVNDIGISSSLFPDQSCGEGQDACREALHGTVGDAYEMMEKELNEVVTYLEFLAVPARDPVDHPKAQRGEKLFVQMNCVACHKQTWTTGNDHRQWRLRNQKIHPYTDLLLHDMGEGLADHRPTYDATGSEWRTPPLWGIGMTERVNGHTDFLHDGRARNLEEAILWHDGEARAAKESFKHLSEDDREAVLAFLRTL